jgi:hypothetical protein
MKFPLLLLLMLTITFASPLKAAELKMIDSVTTHCKWTNTGGGRDWDEEIICYGSATFVNVRSDKAFSCVFHFIALYKGRYPARLVPTNGAGSYASCVSQRNIIGDPARIQIAPSSPPASTNPTDYRQSVFWTVGDTLETTQLCLSPYSPAMSFYPVFCHYLKVDYFSTKKLRKKHLSVRG